MSPNTTPRAATVSAVVRLRPSAGIACTDISGAGLSLASPAGRGQGGGIAPAGAQVNRIFAAGWWPPPPPLLTLLKRPPPPPQPASLPPPPPTPPPYAPP